MQKASFLKRFRWPFVGLISAFIALAPVCPWEPWIMTRLGGWNEVLPLLLGVALAAFIGGLIEGMRPNRDAIAVLTSILVPVLIVVAVRSTEMQALTLSQWKRYFHAHAKEWDEAEAWFRGSTISNQHLTKEEIPTKLRSIASGGRILVRTDKSGVTWMGICVASQGIDNDRVFLWSKEGGPPPEEAYPVIVKSWPMGGGWYFARTT